MLSLIRLPANIIRLLESYVSSREIAAGVCLGMFLGFTPLNGPMGILLVLFFFIFKVNRVSTLLTMPLFKAVYMLGVSGLLEKFGGYLLIDAAGLSGLWATLTGLPVIAYLDLNNTLVMGGIAGSAILSIPLYFAAERVSAALQKTYSEKLKNSRIAKAISGLKIVGKRPAKGWRKRINLTGVVVIAIVLMAIQFGVGLAISPLAGSLIIDTMNRAAKTKISVERVNIWPLTLSFSVKGLKVFDPKKPDTRVVKADEASFRVSPIALLSRRLVFSSIRLGGAEIDLEGRPDGSFNAQGLIGQGVSPKEAPEGGMSGITSLFKMAQKNSPASKFWRYIKGRFSKKGQAERRRERAVNKKAKTVTELPKGRSVHFRAGKGAYLFEIKKLAMDNCRIRLKPYSGEAVEIDKAAVSLGRLAFDPENGAELGLFSIRGDVAGASGRSGGLDIFFSQDENSARIDVDLKELDLDSVRFAYQDVLPVNVERGTITLSFRTSIRSDAIDSRTSLSLSNHRLAAKDGSKLAFGFVPVSAIVEALNGIDPVKLKFSIGGTVEKPEFGGFRESLMALVGPSISNVKDKLVQQGAESAMNALKAFMKKE
ncbi:MAG: TIGR03546 family protein [Candidatus Omnitrophota bacterium]